MQQSVIIGHDIIVTIVDVRPGRVQIAIQAPPEMPIYRHEIVERMIARGESPMLSRVQPAAEVVSVG